MDSIREILESTLSDADFKQQVNELTIDILLDEWDTLNTDESLLIFRALGLDRKVDLISNLSIVEQEEILLNLSAHNSKILFGEMEPDDIVDFIQAVSPEARRGVWESLSEESKRETLFLLRFDEDDASGLMTPRYLEINIHATVGSALSFIRKNALDVETVYYAYVVDEFKRLVGVLSLKQLLLSPDERPVKEIMTEKVVSVVEDTDQEEVARILETYDLMAIPVMDKRGVLLGIVTFDDVMDVIREEQTEDVYRMGAMGGNVDPYLESSILDLFKKRIPWIIVLLLLGTITSNVLKHYETILTGAFFLVVFYPVIAQTGGNSGGQSSTLMIRGLATGELHFRDFGRVFLKELLVGLAMGIVAGVVIILRGVLLGPGDIQLYQAAAIGLALVLVVVFANLIGAMAPLVIHRLGFDPTVTSAPLMSTVIDVFGAIIYFETAKWLFSL